MRRTLLGLWDEFCWTPCQYFKINPDEIFTAKNLDTICENISMLKTPPCDKDKELFERIRLALYDAKANLGSIERRIETMKSK